MKGSSRHVGLTIGALALILAPATLPKPPTLHAPGPARPATLRRHDCPLFDYTPARSGFNAADRSFSVANVSALRRRWVATFDDVADSTPILLAHVAMPRG